MQAYIYDCVETFIHRCYLAGIKFFVRVSISKTNVNALT